MSHTSFSEAAFARYLARLQPPKLDTNLLRPDCTLSKVKNQQSGDFTTSPTSDPVDSEDEPCPPAGAHYYPPEESERNSHLTSP